MNRNSRVIVRTAYRIPMLLVIKLNAWAQADDFRLVNPSRIPFNYSVVTHEQARHHGALDYFANTSVPGAVEL